jgi:hypothetical protein
MVSANGDLERNRSGATRLHGGHPLLLLKLECQSDSEKRKGERNERHHHMKGFTGRGRESQHADVP